MQNILHHCPSEAELSAVLCEMAGRPVIPPLGDTAWIALRNNLATSGWLGTVTQHALTEADEPLPDLTDELYVSFFRTGERIPFERVYFERRSRLGRAAIGALLGDDATSARLLPSFIHKMEEVMDETSWTLPAHVWAEPTGKDPMTIDLCAADTANTFAELLVAFSQVIPTALAGRIRSRLRMQFFENYLERDPPFHWTALPMNWNAVCHQGVLGAALGIENDTELVAQMLARAAHALPVFLSGFGNDGSTSEGPGYWAYGFGRFSELNAQLERRTNGELSFFEGDEKIKRIARFGPHMTFSNGYFVNFSDGPRVGRLNPSLLIYLGNRLSEPQLSTDGATSYRRLAEIGLDVDAVRTDFLFLSRLVLRAPAQETFTATPAPHSPDAFFKDYGTVVARSLDSRGHRWEFAAKGGHNGEHHNHNDCGSFILNVDGSPAFVEIGAPEYVNSYFSSEATRYTFLAARSFGHSVPLVNGCEQHVGRQYSATALECELGEEVLKFVVDLTNCYPAEARCRRLHRSFVFDKTAGRIEVSDAFELQDPGVVESIIICEASVEEEAGAVRIKLAGADLLIRIKAPAMFRGVEPCRYNGPRGDEQQIYRLNFGLPEPALAGAITYNIAIA